jgi:hypothetical protein
MWLHRPLTFLNTICGADKLGQWLNCWLMVQRLRFNLAIATDALMNLSGCRREQIMVLYFEPASPDIKPEMVTA